MVVVVRRKREEKEKRSKLEKKIKNPHRRKLRQVRVGEREDAGPVAVLVGRRGDRVEVPGRVGEDGGFGSLGVCF